MSLAAPREHRLHAFGARINMEIAIRYPYMRRLEIGMVYHLGVLLEECHVTKAAKRCFVSQPAMSRSLERLRETLGYDLLLRSGREYKRTPRGERLLRDLPTLLPKLEGVLQGERFNPAERI